MKTIKKITPTQLAILILCYLITHTFIRLFFSQTIQLDDAEQIRHAQHLALGYPIPQPPLYSWILWVLFKIFGTSLATITLLKYCLIGLTFWFTWLTARELFKHNETIILATTSFLLMPSFAWHMHQGFTHTILLGLALSMSIYFVTRIIRSPTPQHYLLLGISLGIGLMAKYSFVIFLVAMTLSMLFSNHYKKILLNRKILLTLLTTIVIIGPHLWWLMDQNITHSVQGKLQVTSSSGITDRISSLISFLGNAVAFVTPLILFYLISFRSLLHPIKIRLNHHNSHLELLNYFHAIMLITPVVLSIFLSMPDFKIRWFHPIMMLTPLWLLLLTENHKDYLQMSVRPIVYGTAIVTIAIIAIRILQVTAGPELGHHSRLNRPIMETLEQVQTPSSNTLLITEDSFLGAHLLTHYPHHSMLIDGEFYQRSNPPFGACTVFHDNDEWHSPPSFTHGQEKVLYSNPVGHIVYTLEITALPMAECAPFSN